MKKIYFLSMAAASLMLASCSNDDMPAPESGDFATVAVSVQLPDGLQTRYGEGNTATRLHYAVYAKGTKTPLPVCINGTDKNATEGLATINRSTTLNLQLANGQEYDMVFWADAEGSIYSFDATTQEVTAHYNMTDNGTPANQEALDAFYCAKTYKVSGNATISAQLKRPFAQVNIVTDDLKVAEDGGFVPANSSLKTKVASGLNLMTGNVIGDDAEVTFAANTLPSGKMTVNGKEYAYIGMNYLLVPAEKSLRDIDFTLLAAGTENVETHVYNFNSVPVQRNYRTNIYGSLLTSSQNFNVEILPGFFDPNYDYEVVTNSADLLTLLENNDNLNLLINEDMVIDRWIYVGDDYANTVNIALSEGATVSALSNRSACINVYAGGTLNLNGTGKFVGPIGNKLSGIGSAAIAVENSNLNIYGNLTFDGGSGSKNNNYAILVRGGTANIYGGYFHVGVDANGDANPCVYVGAPNKEASCNIYGGVFESEKPQYLLNIDDAQKSKCSLKVYGGTFVGFNPADNSADGAHTNYLADGYKVVEHANYNGTGLTAYEVVPE